MSTLEAALAWARRGCRVFPLQADSKVPLDIGWTLSATTDENVICNWWTDPVLGSERDYNVGWLTDGWIVADVDVKDGKRGLETAERLGLRIGETLTMRTPSGGFHCVYAGLPNPVSNSPLGLGIDVRSHHGFIVAPGSTIGGVPYVVHADEPVAEFPNHLRHLLKAPRERADVVPASVDLDARETVELARHYLRQEAPPALEGANGDDTTYRVCCRLRDFGLSENTALELFLDEYAIRCEPPWSPEEARLKIENAYRYATGSAGSRSPAAAFGHVQPVISEARRKSCEPKLLETLNGRAFALREVFPRPWLVERLIPDRTVTLLSGDGGTGKSLVAQQLAVAVATGGLWLGHTPARGGAVYLSAEDDLDEVHRRLVDIIAANGLCFDDLADLHVIPMAGKDAVLAASDRHSDQMTETTLWVSLVATVRILKPRLLVLDNLADVFAGNENARPQARQFIGMLRGLAIECQLAVLVIAHPSLTGLSNGTGTSGSTAWSNSVRSRLFIERAKREGDDPDPDLRVLRVMKANYAPIGLEIALRWTSGTLQLAGDDTGSFDRAAAEAKAERVLLELLQRYESEGRRVSPSRSASYAPTVLAKDQDAQGITKTGFERAMNRLIRSKRIRAVPYGPPSKTYQCLVVVAAQA